jgi:hypothetical protein
VKQRDAAVAEIMGAEGQAMKSSAQPLRWGGRAQRSGQRRSMGRPPKLTPEQ